MNEQIASAIKEIYNAIESGCDKVIISKESAKTVLLILFEHLDKAQICKIHDVNCIGYKAGRCVSIENCSGKELIPEIFLV